MYWLLLNMYSENFGFGPGGFIIIIIIIIIIIRGTFVNSKNGLDRTWVI